MKCAARLWLGVWAAIPTSLIAQRSLPISPEVALQRTMGVAGSGFSGGVCLAIRATPLPAGEQFILVHVPVVGARGQAEALGARVDSVTSADCNRDASPVASYREDSVYTLSLLQGHLAPGAIYFAVHAPVDRIHVSGGAASAAVDGFSRRVTFRVCTSNEGVHLTAWTGAPLTSKRLCHRYVHFEHEFFVPNCRQMEYEAPD